MIFTLHRPAFIVYLSDGLGYVAEASRKRGLRGFVQGIAGLHRVATLLARARKNIGK